MAEQRDQELGNLGKQDQAVMRDAARKTRLVRMQVGARSYSLGWFEVEPGESPALALAEFLRHIAARLEEMDAEC